MGKIELDHTGSGGGVTLSSDGTDLLLDGTAIGGGGGGTFTIDDKTASYSIVSGDLGKVIRFTSGTVDANLPASSGLPSGFSVSIWNDGTGVISVKPDGSDFIGESLGNGYTTSDPYKLNRGKGLTLCWNSSRWNISAEKPYDYYHHSIAIGSNSSATNNYAMAIGNRSSASGVGTVAIGTGLLGPATATSNFAVALGEYATASGSYSVALGKSRTGGTDSFAAAIASNSSSYGATGANSVAIGDLSKATNTNAVCISNTSTASGTNSAVLGGSSGTASGSNSVTVGGSSNTASGTRSLAYGYYGNTNGITNKVSHGIGPDRQNGMYGLAIDTTDATPAALATDYFSAGALTQIILPNNSAYAFHGTIVARQQASQGTACAAWKIEGLIRREGSAGTTVLVNSATTVLDNTPSWGLALSADTTNGGLKIEATGAASTNIRWVATIHTSEVTY